MKLIKICLYLAAGYLCAVSVAMEAHAATKEKKLLCWTNSEGVKECGDKLPPEYAQEGHTELNKKGKVLKETGRPKTEEEVAEAKKQAELKAEAAKAAREQKKKDKILLDTFTSVKDIEVARDGKLSSLKSTITLAKKRSLTLQKSLDAQIKMAAAAELEGKPPADKTLKDIQSLKRQIKENNEFITNTQKEEEEVKASYESDIARFKELTEKKE